MSDVLLLRYSNTYNMRNILFVAAFCLLSQFANAQFGASIHQSNLPFVGINYQFKERFLPELRIGTDNYFDNTSLELTFNYIFKKDENVDVYTGLGARVQILDGIVVPLGMNIYPFTKDNFGFQMELAAIVGSSDPLLRGSWGIRYRFAKE